VYKLDYLMLAYVLTWLFSFRFPHSKPPPQEKHVKQVCTIFRRVSAFKIDAAGLVSGIVVFVLLVVMVLFWILCHTQAWLRSSEIVKASIFVLVCFERLTI